MDNPFISIIFGYRDRELTRVKRCLDSLANQTYTNFEVIFVDYGSDEQFSGPARNLLSQYSFSRYLYSHTNGWPWNRGRALNTGVRLAKGEYIFTNDIDLIFSENYLAKLASILVKDKVFYPPTHYLEKNFNQWNRLNQVPRKKYHQMKGISILSKEAFASINGYDEQFIIWGQEDEDLFGRLEKRGFEFEWLSDDYRLFHQWHPHATNTRPCYINNYYWANAQLYQFRMKNIIVRNSNEWGHLYSLNDRPLLLSNNKVTAAFERPCYAQDSVMRLVDLFEKAQAGDVIRVKACSGVKGSAALSVLNRLIRKVWMRGWQREEDLVSGFLWSLIQEYSEKIEDYLIDNVEDCLIKFR